MNDLCDDINFSSMSLDDSDRNFFKIIGHIEEIIIRDKFKELLNNFLEQHYREFEDTDENKLVYMDVFKKYTEVIEKFIEDELHKTVDNFSMQFFEKELVKRQNELDGEIFEVLSTFNDFLAFKTMFLDYKEVKEGEAIDFSKDLLVTKYEVDTTT